MGGLASLFEPEELFGAFWHRVIGDVGAEARYPEEAVSLDDITRRLEIFFRGLGGDAGVEIKAITPQSVDYRQKVLAKIGHGSTAVSQARFDGDHLFLPATLELLPDKTLNSDLYKWLTAWAAAIGTDIPAKTADPLQNDILSIRFVLTITDKVFERYPGFKKTINATLKELHNDHAKKFKIVHTKDGSGIGVAVVAAVIAHGK